MISRPARERLEDFYRATESRPAPPTLRDAVDRIPSEHSTTKRVDRRVLLAAAAILVAGMTLSAGFASLLDDPRPTPDATPGATGSGVIAFEAPSGNVVSYEYAAGTQREMLKCDLDECSFAPGGWSPDGSVFVYRRATVIEALDLTTGETRTVTQCGQCWAIGDPQVSPDGALVAFAVYTTVLSYPDELWVSTLTGEDRTTWAISDLSWYEWMSDGSAIAFYAVGTGASNRIGVIDLTESSPPTRILIGDPCPQRVGPSRCIQAVDTTMSTDRLTFALLDAESGESSIHSVAGDGSDDRTIYRSDELISSVALSADGSQVALSQGCELALVDAVTSSVATISPVRPCSERAVGLAWAPDGRGIAYVTPIDNELGNLHVVDRAGAPLDAISPTLVLSGWQTPFAWRP